MTEYNYDAYHKIVITHPGEGLTQYRVEYGFLYKEGRAYIESDVRDVFVCVMRPNSTNYLWDVLASHDRILKSDYGYEFDSMVEILSKHYYNDDMYTAQLLLMALSMRYNNGYGFEDGQEIRIIHYKED